MRAFAVAAGLLLWGPWSLARAQDVTGRLVAPDGTRPAAGVLIVAERARDGRTIARAVTGPSGTWRLTIGPDSVIVRVLRIGFAPQVLDTLQLAPGTRRELHAVLADIAIAIPPSRTDADRRCRVPTEGASATATRFHQARIALAVAQVAPADAALRLRVRVSEEVWSPDDARLLDSTSRAYETADPRPFATAPVDTLLTTGFVTRRRSPFARTNYEVVEAVEYRLPGIDFFVDDRFPVEYCVRMAAPPREHPDWIGVAFEPVRRRRVTQLRGTLWLDARTAELRQLDFTYADLDASAARIEPGGRLEFARSGSGHWYVSRWTVKAPGLGEYLERAGGATMRVTLREVPVIRVRGEAHP